MRFTSCATAILLVGACLAAGCGYRPASTPLPAGYRSVSVPAVENRSAHAGLSAELTASLRRQLARRGAVVVPEGEGAPRLLCAVIGAAGEAGTLGAERNRLVPVDTLWRIELEGELVRADGLSLAGPIRVSASGRSIYGRSAAEAEALGRRERSNLLDAAARRLLDRLGDSPPRPKRD
ncbi:MAG: LPS assembly lipoprotein LptE [Polyangia bacterium]